MAKTDTRPRISLPYVPISKGGAGRPRKHSYQYRIAYSLQMRGENEDVPVILMHGAPDALVKEACTEMCRCMGDGLKDILITKEHSCRVRNGKCYWRLALHVCGLNEDFLSLDGFIITLMQIIRRKANCDIRSFSLVAFLNQ